jgi:hypothetical protein
MRPAFPGAGCRAAGLSALGKGARAHLGQQSGKSFDIVCFAKFPCGFDPQGDQRRIMPAAKPNRLIKKHCRPRPIARLGLSLR